ncbi:MAG: prephenate dehydrogenase/arogenate dehydrogenase family protein [Acidimicrobiia bacterium]
MEDNADGSTPSAGIIGLGLIGSSISAGLVDAGWHTTGYDPDPDVVRFTTDRSLVSAVAATIPELVGARSDIVIVAAPPGATIEILSGLRMDGPVMDVAGVKTAIRDAAAHLPGFVGTHPMAGRETSGPAASSAALFRGATWVLVDGGNPEAVGIVQAVVDALGARPILMDAQTHDRAVASISHLPQILSGALLAMAAGTEGAMDLAAGSFRDLTRVAASQPLPWVELLKANAPAVLAAIGALKNQLSLLEAGLMTDDDTLMAHLVAGREARDALGAPVTAVRVALADQPGELAKVGHALEASQVDVRDIQMRHAPHGGGGVLTVSVRPGEEGALAHALEDAGLLLVP